MAPTSKRSRGDSPISINKRVRSDNDTRSLTEHQRRILSEAASILGTTPDALQNIIPYTLPRANGDLSNGDVNPPPVPMPLPSQLDSVTETWAPLANSGSSFNSFIPAPSLTTFSLPPQPDPVPSSSLFQLPGTNGIGVSDNCFRMFEYGVDFNPYLPDPFVGNTLLSSGQQYLQENWLGDFGDGDFINPAPGLNDSNGNDPFLSDGWLPQPPAAIDQVPALNSKSSSDKETGPDTGSASPPSSPRDEQSPNKQSSEEPPTNGKTPKKISGRRGPFKDDQERAQTKLTRRLGACIRCRLQKIRCILDVKNPTGPCLSCKAVTETTLTRPIYSRHKVTDAKLFEKGPHPQFRWSRRWKSMNFVEITDWKSTEVKTIRVTQDVNNLTYTLRVREFTPKPGDSLRREWKTRGVQHSYPCTNYAIENMAEAGKRHVKFVDDNIEASIDYYIDKSDWLLYRTYMAALKASTNLEDEEERGLLRSVLKLWVSIRMESRSERICGPESLGMTAQTWDADAANYGQVLIPPVMSAQIELIATVAMLHPMRKAVLGRLRKLIEKNRTGCWYTVYLCLFILLHSCALLTDFENRQAKKYGLETRYVYEPLVQELHLGAKILLSYFHYCNKGSHPFQLDWQSSPDVHLAGLGDEEKEFIQESSKRVREKADHFRDIRENGRYEDPFYFLSQLYDPDWSPQSLS